MATVKIERKQFCVIIIAIMLAVASYFIPVAETRTRAAEAVPKTERLPENHDGNPEKPAIPTRRVLAALPEVESTLPNPPTKTERRTDETTVVIPAKPMPPIERLTARDFSPTPGAQLLYGMPAIPITQDQPFGLKPAARN